MNARRWGWWERDDWHMWRWLSSCFGCGTLYTMSWALYMALCCGRTWVEVLIYKFDADVRAPFEKPPFSSFEKGGNLWVAQRLVHKFDIIDPCSNRV